MTAEPFLQRLIDLTLAEQQAEELESSLLSSSCPFNQLVAKGIALGGLQPVKTSLGLGGRTLVDLERSLAHHQDSTFPPHGFRSGDSVRLLGDAAGGAKSKGKKKGDTATAGQGAEGGLEGVVWKVQEKRIVIALGSAGKGANQDDEAEEVPPNIRLLKLSNPTTYLRQISSLRSAIRQLSLPSPLPPLITLSLGLSSPPPPTPLPPSFTFLDPTLNPSQQSAVQHALTHSLSLIWGPPGTGKTQTLVEVIRQLVLVQGLRVLVCGGSNLSVDNVLQRLSAKPSSDDPRLATPIPLTRLGHPTRVLTSLTPWTLDSQSSASDSSALVKDIKAELEQLEGRLRITGKERVRGSERKKGWDEVRELRRDYRRREGGVVGEVVGKARVVLGTTHGVGSRILQNQHFDVIVIDEAAQATEPACWIPLANQPRATKLILAGDHLQLPPTIKSLDSSSGSKSKKSSKKEDKPKTTASTLMLTEEEQKKEDSSKENSTSAPAPPPSAAADESQAAEPSPPPPALSTLSLSPSSPSTPSTSTSTTRPDPTTTTTTLTRSFPLAPSPSLSLTLFERLLALHGPQIRTMLSVSYRFNSKICEFPSRELYEGELGVGERNGGWKLVDLLDGEEEEEEEGVMGEEVVFVDTAGLAMYERSGDEGTFGAESKSNENEADLCVKYVEGLTLAGLPASSITLLSPYNSQVTLLASLLHPRWPEIEVGSVDGMQGRENEVVVISLVRSNEKGEVGFLADERRLNVAMTRPKRQLVVIGDSETVSKGSGYLKRWMQWLEENAWVQVPE
ncbi:AAA domain-domain-containing protein [Leucosporidium creatinivorum]|uniref:DNA helicase n=1 Tax=Leucosporidium creatinivorum TaxID=106004 RepID=A0A1Y2F0B8_9BASI|nr:AAA domain-domain-containing protein [Leucosporidium creatinivorum]